jgi:hypothetical protein
VETTRPASLNVPGPPVRPNKMHHPKPPRACRRGTKAAARRGLIVALSLVRSAILGKVSSRARAMPWLIIGSGGANPQTIHHPLPTLRMGIGTAWNLNPDQLTSSPSPPMHHPCALPCRNIPPFYKNPSISASKFQMLKPPGEMGTWVTGRQASS